MPEESHLLFKRTPGISHPGKPPAQKLAAVKVGKVERVRKIEATAKQVLHHAIVALLVVEEEIDGAFAPTRSNIVDLRWAPAETHPSEEMSGVLISNSRHVLPLPVLRASLLSLPCGCHPFVARHAHPYDSQK